MSRKVYLKHDTCCAIATMHIPSLECKWWHRVTLPEVSTDPILLYCCIFSFCKLCFQSIGNSVEPRPKFLQAMCSKTYRPQGERGLAGATQVQERETVWLKPSLCCVISEYSGRSEIPRIHPNTAKSDRSGFSPPAPSCKIAKWLFLQGKRRKILNMLNIVQLC